MRDDMTNPYQKTATARLISDRIRDLAHKKTQAEIASEAGFPNANMMTFLKNGRSKVPLDRVPSLAKALEVDPAYPDATCSQPGCWRDCCEGDHRHLRDTRPSCPRSSPNLRTLRDR